MQTVVPIYRTMHVLFVEDDWVIRQILLEHFATEADCRVVSFHDADQALAYLRQRGEGERIFSNVGVGGRGGIDLSSGTGWQSRIELAVAPGYDAERDRFQAIEDGFGFFRVKPFSFNDLWQALRQSSLQSSFH
jgi:DNA-binding NtrC family response regulator